jgi:signal transduction histidine kinase
MTVPMDALVERLAHQRTLTGLPRHELEWLAAHGSIERFEPGQVVAAADEVPDKMYVMLAGTMAIYVERDGVRRKAMEWKSGDVTGMLPYSRMGRAPGDTVAVSAEPIEGFSVNQRDFPEMIRECPELVARLVHLMLDRARFFKEDDLYGEKLKSLGRLSARLAHELNNPASAAERSAAGLLEQLATLEVSARALGAMDLPDDQLKTIDALRRECQAAVHHEVRSAIDQADREDAIADWLEAHGADADIAHPLAESSVTIELLDRLAGAVQGPPLDAALRSIAAGCATRALAGQIESAAARMHHLVSAMKGFSYMDRAAAPAPFDLAKNLSDTLTIHQWKARQKSIAVNVSVPPDLPPVVGVGGELNQVWANLLDNALDAAPDGGHVSVKALRRGDALVVSFEDDGPGIPESVRSRIFEPLFTTKPVGAGTGQGLDIVRKVLDRHQGDVSFDSEPGRTVFTVTLPMRGPRS